MADGRLIRALMNCHGLKAPGGLLDLDLGQENEPVLEMGGWDSVPKNALREEGACGSVPSLSSFHFTPILLLWRGDPGVTDRSPVSPSTQLHPFPGWASSVLWPERGQGTPVPSTPCLLSDRTLLCQIPSESVARESWEGVAGEASASQTVLGAPQHGSGRRQTPGRAVESLSSSNPKLPGGRAATPLLLQTTVTRVRTPPPPPGCWKKPPPATGTQVFLRPREKGGPFLPLPASVTESSCFPACLL